MRIKDRTFLYSFGAVLVSTGVRTFYKKHQAVGLDNIPKDKPILLAANHQNAFLDPTLIGIKVKKPIYFMVRADIFKKKTVAKILWAVNMMPIFRKRDGGNTIKKNEAVFDKCYDLLNEKKPILIFAEGNQGNQKKLRPLQKGIFRIGLGAIEKYKDLDVQIVPIGLYYSDTLNMGAKLLINIGKPIPLKDYSERFNTDEAHTLNDLKSKLSHELSELMIDIQESEYYDTIHEMLFAFEDEIFNKERLPKNTIYEEFKCQKNFINKTSNWIEKHPKEAIKLKQEIESFSETTKKLNLRPWLFRKETQSIFFWVFWLILASPIHLYGMINSYLPYKLPEMFVQKKVKDIHFHSSIKMAMSVILFWGFWGIQMGLVAIFTDNYTWLWYFASLLLSAWFSYEYWIDLLKTRGKWRYNKLTKSKDKQFTALKKSRAKILTYLEGIYKEEV